jgi:hypothetical protein
VIIVSRETHDFGGDLLFGVEHFTLTLSGPSFVIENEILVLRRKSGFVLLECQMVKNECRPSRLPLHVSETLTTEKMQQTLHLGLQQSLNRRFKRV